MISSAVLAQAGLDAAYDTYAFGREGDLTKGLVAGAAGLPLGIAGAAAATRFLPPKYRLAGAMIGNFAGSILGAELGMAGLNAFRTARNYQQIEQQPLTSQELQGITR